MKRKKKVSLNKMEEFYPPYHVPEFGGFGVNVNPSGGLQLSNQIVGLQGLTSAKVYMNLPSQKCQNQNTDSEFDVVWTENIHDVRNTISLLDKKITIAFNNKKDSFLANNGQNKIIGDSLFRYVRYVVSGLKVLKDFHVDVVWVELVDSFTPNYISPENYTLLVRCFKKHMLLRNLSVKVMGPGVCMLGSSDLTDPYVAAFAGTVNLLDGWSFVATEDRRDYKKYQKGDHAARMLMFKRAGTLVDFMNFTLPGLPVFVSKFTTLASKFTLGVDYGPNPANPWSFLCGWRIIFVI